MSNKLRIAWDCDDTLLIPAIVTGLPYDTPNYENIDIYRWFQSQGHDCVIWSGGGIDYARMWANKLGLNPTAVIEKNKKGGIDLCFDDCDVDLATVNIKVKRLKNSISRKDWNKHEHNKN
jgi:hypothetical protein